MARHKAIRQSPNCTYCGVALTPDTVTVDHVPPLALFDFRDRPKGFEFPSCKPCNNGARLTDLVIAVLSRIYPDGPTEKHAAEMGKLIADLSRRAPDVLQELMPNRAVARAAKKRTGGRDVLRLGGPLVSGHLERFAARFGYAVHYHATKCLLPARGGVISKIFTNYDLINGEFPSEIVDSLGAPITLQAGEKHAGDQFAFGFKYTEDGAATMGFASIRESFAFFTFSADDPSRLGFEEKATVYRPGFLQQQVKAEFPTIRWRPRTRWRR